MLVLQKDLSSCVHCVEAQKSLEPPLMMLMDAKRRSPGTGLLNFEHWSLKRVNRLHHIEATRLLRGEIRRRLRGEWQFCGAFWAFHPS